MAAPKSRISMEAVIHLLFECGASVSLNRDMLNQSHIVEMAVAGRYSDEYSAEDRAYVAMTLEEVDELIAQLSEIRNFTR